MVDRCVKSEGASHEVRFCRFLHELSSINEPRGYQVIVLTYPRSQLRRSLYHIEYPVYADPVRANHVAGCGRDGLAAQSLATNLKVV